MATEKLLPALKKYRGTLDVTVMIPAGAGPVAYTPPRTCKVWALRGQVVNGPGLVNGGGAILTFQTSGGVAFGTMEFDTTGATPTPDGLVDAGSHRIPPGEGISIVKGHTDQSGWVVLTLGFDLTQVGPVPPL
ncbi:MAG: hypothetical protein PHC52_00590 [Syntrophales bacterium]|nr:hypothetical protein [Syntrophales bacterium]